MALYEELCEKCGAIEERLQPFHEPPVGICPRCGGPSHRIISGSSFVIPGFEHGERITEEDMIAGKYAKKHANRR